MVDDGTNIQSMAGDTAGNAKVVGNVAAGAADSGNPVKVAGVYNSTRPTLTNAQRGDLQLGTRGSLAISIFGVDSGTGVNVFTSNADGQSYSNGLSTNSQNAVSNGSTWDKMRGVTNATNSTGVGIVAVGLVAQLDDTSPTAITENQFGNVRMSANRALMVEQVFTYNHISTATTTTVKSGAGFLHALSVNLKGTVASTITVYDNTAGSGTVIGVIDSLNLSGAFILDVAFGTGLTIVTTGTIAPDITVSYR